MPTRAFPPGELAPLYKYRSLRTPQERKFVQRIFSHQELFFSSRKLFNDPFDCRAQYRVRGTRSEFFAYCEKMLRKRAPHLTTHELHREIAPKWEVHKRNIAESEAALHEMAEYIDQQLGVFCLSERPDHILMWSHYADSHAGICLEFDRNQEQSVFRNAERVLYRARYPIVRVLQQSSEQIGRTALCTKSRAWEYEREWRLIDSSRGPGIQRFSAELLTGVILGAKLDPRHQKSVIAWIRAYRCRPKLYQAQIHPHKYLLEIQPVAL
jgi:hypothetical protein